jgi:hypothetical protein
MSPSTGVTFSLLAKLLLALASIAAYALISNLADALEPVESVPDPGFWFHYLAGAIFGALVLTPYAGADRRAMRVAGLCIASALVYRLAVWFVTEGPLDYDVVATFAITGAGAAVLCALAVVLIAPQPKRALAFVLALVAGALGGASFDLKLSSDQYLLVSHGIWQLLVCLALHAGFRQRTSA